MTIIGLHAINQVTMSHTSRILIAASLLVVAASRSWAQTSPGTIVTGVLAMQGTQGEAGVGLTAAFRRPLNGALAAEFGVHVMSGVAESCPLSSVPGGCSSNAPASPSFYARLTVRQGTGTLYLTMGLGAYAPVGPPDNTSVAAGLDGGLGVRFSRRVALEARMLGLQNERWLGWVVPVGVAITL